jgi:hypothetical protein
LGEYQLAGRHVPPADGFLQLNRERLLKSSAKVVAWTGLGLRVGLGVLLRVGLGVGLRLGLRVGLRVGLGEGLAAMGPAEVGPTHSSPFQ